MGHPTRHFDVAERRRRLVVRHHLTRPAATVEQVAGELVGLHSTDPATVVLSARARLATFQIGDLEAALYDRRTLLRMLAMRRTMFVATLDLAAVMDAACTRALVPVERRKLVTLLESAGVTAAGDRWIDRVGDEVLAALRANGPTPASGLTKLVPELAGQVPMAVGKAYEGTIGVSTRLLFLLSAEGRIARAQPLGSWLSSQYRWVAMADWIGELPVRSAEEARTELARRWLGTYGPGTLDDLTWWTKWTKTQARAALSSVGAIEVTVDATEQGGPVPAWVLADDVDDTPARLSAPRGLEPVSLLPALDPTVMGWKGRDWYLGPHRVALFDGTGNAGPTVWVGGRAVGAWSQRAGGEVVTRLLEPVDGPATARIDAAAAELTAWMDGARVTPRFPTALHRELANI